MATFRGKPPGGSAGTISRKTERLRPAIALRPPEIARARRLRRGGMEPDGIASALGVPLEEVEKALVQMRSPRPESTRGTLNVTLEAHRTILAERIGDEPLWRTVDRLVGELLQLRAEKAPGRPARRGREPGGSRQPSLL